MTTSGDTNGRSQGRRTSQVCVLSDGRRVSFYLKRRSRDPYYLACFRGPDRIRKERSTKEANKRRATDAAIAIVTQEYTPREAKPNPSWDAAIDLLKRYTKAENLRPKTIQQYEIAVGLLRGIFPETHGPGDISPTMAGRFKLERLEAGLAPRTVAGNIDNLSIVYGHWWCGACDILTENPFADIDPPREDKRTPRVISADEAQEFMDWLSARWNGWRLPLLFLDVKGVIGCRIGELAKTPTDNLKVGRLYFEAVTTKGRKQRAVKLPPALYDELCSLAGPTFVFEAFSRQLRAIHRKRKNFHHAAMVKKFAPERLIDWLQNQTADYFKANPDAKKFKLHNFRGTAMSKARMAGVSYDDAAIAFGCNPQTMREHYIALEEQEISDRVMDKIQNESGEN